MNICAIIVIYNYDVTSIDLTSISANVDHLYIVDNSDIQTKGQLKFNDNNITFIQNYNKGYLAGAYNKVLFDQNILQGFTHILFLDQDSDFSELSNYLNDKLVLTLLDKENIIVAPRYYDVNTLIKGRCVQLTKYWFRVSDNPEWKDNSGIPVSFVINSFSLWPVKIIRKLGKYDEGLALDHIDTDYCLRARISGYDIRVINHISLGHQIGQRQSSRFLFWNIQSTCHSDFRVNMISFNTARLIKKYYFTIPGFVPLAITRILYDYFCVLYFERSIRKSFIILTGFIKGFFSRQSKI